MILLSWAFAAPLDDCLADPDARERYRCAYRVARSSNDYPGVIERVRAEGQLHPEHTWAVQTLASLLSDTGDREASIPLYEQARDRFDEEDDVLGRVYSRLNLGNHTHQLGRDDASDRAYTEAATIAAENERLDLAHAARLSHARNLATDTTRLGEAWTIANAVHDEVFPAGEYQARLLALHVMTLVAESTNRRDEHRQLLERTLLLAKEEGDTYVQHATLASLAAMLAQGFAHGDAPPDAPARVEQITAELVSEGSPYFVAEAHCTRSSLAFYQERREDAVTHASACVDAWNALEDPYSRAYVWLAFAHDDVEASEAAWARAVELEAEDPVEAAKLDLERLELLGRRGDVEGLVAAVPAARAAVDVLREQAGDPTSRSALPSTTLQFLEMGAFWVADADLALALALAEITRGEPGDTVVDLEALQAAIPPDTTVLVPIVPATSDRGAMVVLGRERRSVVPIQGLRGIETRIGGLDGLVRSRDPGVAEASRGLYETLLAPVAPTTERLVLVPTGALSGLAWAGLSTDEGPLGATHVVTLARSLSRYLEREPPTIGSALALADPSNPADGLPPLPASRAEAAAALAVLPGEGALVAGDRATGEVLLESAASWLHLGAHGVVDQRFPERTALYLADGERMTATRIRAATWTDRVVVLAACRSAGGRILGDRPLGLADAFYDGGAATVIGSLWPIRDADAEVLLASFYEGVGRGLPLDMALAQAQRGRIAAGAPHEAWAGMVLIGDGRVRVPPKPSSSWWWLLVPVAVLVAGAVAWSRRRSQTA